MSANPKPNATKPGKPKAPANETERDRFIRLGTGRVNKALQALRQIGNLSGPSYDYSDIDISKMQAAIESATKRAFDRLRNRGSAPKADFSL